MTTMKEYMELDKSVILNTDEFAESGTLTTTIGVSSAIVFLRSRTSDLAPIEPGYSDTASFRCSSTSYTQPQIGDTITDASGVVWIVEPGSILERGMWWLVPVKSDRRVRS